ncbi:hypothetical protein N865_09305 [Intrasporangium oryzae NRRL B-24470]|uniref:Integral membrane protein n=1 Tax=Intrasporangium oryzae NRRL B-24470 TaxID=1386089 RepID=W9GEP4_9MICO|nr:hypothetical protein [Intrasporangium oryzae]EWT03692.1 hypothetical protein N865_09305 [Intrasporangium oryzae NRRL B-24470]
MKQTDHETSVIHHAENLMALRYAAVVLAGIIGVLYGILFFLVRSAESAPGATDTTTYGAYLFLAIAYLAGSWALAVVGRRMVWVIGAIVQVVVLALFVVFGVGLLGPGVFDYAALSDLSMGTWAAAITVAEVALLGLLVGLAVAKPAEI